MRDIEPTKEIRDLAYRVVQAIYLNTEIDSVEEYERITSVVEPILASWTPSYVTEELLRAQNGGALAVGSNCEVAVRGTTEKMVAFRDSLNQIYNLDSHASAEETANEMYSIAHETLKRFGSLI